MKRILKVTNIVSGIKVLAKDSVGRTFQISTDRTLSVGQSILVVNETVAGIVKTIEPVIYEV